MSTVAADRPAEDLWDRTVGRIVPPILYGLRFAASIDLALLIAFWLELDDPNWAGTSAGIVAQPTLGQSLRKGFFRFIGTALGAAATVALTACFPQDRLGFLLGMAVWAAACSFVSTILRNFAAYAAMLAGYTMVIIASDSINTPDRVFMLAVWRATEIWIGIICAMIVIAGTDFGAARRRLAATIGALVDDLSAAVRAALGESGPPAGDDRTARRTLTARVAALDALIDQGIGESAELRYRRATLYAAMKGLFDVIIAWRVLVLHLATLGPERARQAAGAVLRAIPPVPAGAAAADWIGRRERSERIVRTLSDLKAEDPSARLLADAAARAALGFGRAANGIVLLEDAPRSRRVRVSLRLHVPDVLPPLWNALRVFLTVVIATLFWIVTEWPSGLSAITFAAVTVLLLSPQQELGVKAAFGFGLGTCVAAVVAAVVKFAVLPNNEGFASLAVIIAATAVPLAALSTVPSLRGVFTGAAMNFIPLLGPTNEITYDTTAFYNAALAIVGGCAFGALMMRLFPPIPPPIRARRLARLTLRDLRRLARRRGPMPTLDGWRRRIALRLISLPQGTDPEHGAQIVAALSVGRQIIRLRRYARPRGLDGEVSAALDRLAAGDLDGFDQGLAGLDHLLADEVAAGGIPRQRIRAAILVLREAVTGHEDYFGAPA